MDDPLDILHEVQQQVNQAALLIPPGVFFPAEDINGKLDDVIYQLQEIEHFDLIAKELL